jgi:Ferritin-like
MTHLALIANLTTAVGGGAHFFRPEFLVRPGYFPSEFVLEFAPFNQETLQHFIFLERPEDEPIEDAGEFTPAHEYSRSSARGRLMDHTDDYSTVGQL